ncbi:DUF4354 family protein [Serratia marcescens]|uniref:DUF4354 family protein n=1 Tax=Serratia TaxID=613 RepID=UPI0018D93D1C|nr:MULTISPECIES: DUF4354 family protein [unclassified Serratia (in: enterobacteria)]MBH2765634.1 DUF4354 family protein [Serratia marcescens]MBH2922503.1 DUF4354 family protein [Serratia marcescens]MBH3028033.1 DUF4354 family protein [Serratia marcescens]MBH3042519.1 DUF4354 family protein [Serratia marcescens]MBN5416078.1 DUF4354 family protein [Serratia marcescens]
MKISTIITSLTLAGFCFAANASTLSNVAVYATEQSRGSVSIGDKTVYTKTFEVSIAKLSADTVALSKLCLKAYSPDNKEFKLDTVDEILTSGFLKEGKLIKGSAVFASENDAVLKAALVKISDDCK